MTGADGSFVSLSNENFVKILLVSLLSISLGSSTGLLYCVTSRRQCEERNFSLLDLRWTFSAQDVGLSFVVGCVAYLARTYFGAAVKSLARMTPSRKRVLALLIPGGAIEIARFLRRPRRAWLLLLSPLSVLSCLAGLASNSWATGGAPSVSIEGCDLQSQGDAPTPTPRSSKEDLSVQERRRRKMAALARKKRALERRLKTEAKFHSLQERLSELLSLNRVDEEDAAPEEGDKKRMIPRHREPVLKSRRVMMRLHERLEAVEKEMAEYETTGRN